MAQLAALLKKKGYNITGSDKEFYHPALSILKEAEINNLSSFKKENITKDIALAVIGNSQSYTNCEVQEIESLNIPYTCFPKLLYELIIKKRRSVVVSGTHGKTTTTALTAWCFKTAGFNPSYFIGGKVTQLNPSLFQGEKYSVVEGDEYDSAFFAKIPKFTFYSPDILIITNIDFDHADIYRSLEEIEEQFSRLVSSVPNHGFIIACIDNPTVRKNLATWQRKTKATIITYGKSELADYRLLLRETKNNKEKVEILTPSGKDTYLLGITGEHNALNSTAVYAVFKEEGLPIDALKEGLKTFKGVKRRQEIVYQNQTVLIDDFAHHPKEVLATVKSIRDKYPEKRVIAVFEPRSNT
ncbi:MAG: UDP-N-acetylmuramate:L-alanyl-gamma-D-glutamyl-meso-diaminopimelate ligase, partial [Candidatus Dadabacteria bacterium]